MGFYKGDITDEQKQYAWGLVRKADFKWYGKYKSDLGIDDEKARERLYVGKLGEVCFADAAGLTRPSDYKFDDGVDFVIGGKNIDVKTNLTRYPVHNGYRNAITKRQFENQNYNIDVYAFVMINKKDSVYTICGWIPKFNISHKTYFNKGDEIKRPSGSKFTALIDGYYIPVEDMTTFNPYSFEVEMTMFR